MGLFSTRWTNYVQIYLVLHLLTYAHSSISRNNHSNLVVNNVENSSALDFRNNSEFTQSIKNASLSLPLPSGRSRRKSRYLDYSSYKREAEISQDPHEEFNPNSINHSRPHRRRIRSRHYNRVGQSSNRSPSTHSQQRRQSGDGVSSNNAVPLHQSFQRFRNRTSDSPVPKSQNVRRIDVLDTQNVYSSYGQPYSNAIPYGSRLNHGRAYNDPNYYYSNQVVQPYSTHQKQPQPYPTFIQNNYQQPTIHHYQPVNPYQQVVHEQPNAHTYQSQPQVAASVQNPPNERVVQAHASSSRPIRTNETSNSRRSQEVEESSSSQDSDDLRVGRSLNVFSRYGFLTLSIKATGIQYSDVGSTTISPFISYWFQILRKRTERVASPSGDSDFLFRENTADIFERNSYWGKREARRHTGNFDTHFYIHFCSNLSELLKAYFDHFRIEGVPDPYKAFTSSLSSRALAKQFGLSSSFLNGHFSYVLVRLFRRSRRTQLDGPLEITGTIKKGLENVNVGSTESVHEFIDKFGSHVITEFEVGDMMYQTFVFGERLYRELKNTFADTPSEGRLDQLKHFLTPNYAAKVGEVQLASGNNKLERILERRTTNPELLMYPNIFKLFDDEAVEEDIEGLRGEVILSLKLEKISGKLPPSPKTRWMSEVLDNTLAIYYHHMSSTRKNT